MICKSYQYTIKSYLWFECVGFEAQSKKVSRGLVLIGNVHSDTSGKLGRQLSHTLGSNTSRGPESLGSKVVGVRNGRGPKIAGVQNCRGPKLPGSKIAGVQNSLCKFQTHSNMQVLTNNSINFLIFDYHNLQCPLHYVCQQILDYIGQNLYNLSFKVKHNNNKSLQYILIFIYT